MIKIGICYLRWVDDSDHTILAMATLGAVEPDGLRLIGDGVSELLSSNLFRILGEDIAREQSVV